MTNKKSLIDRISIKYIVYITGPSGSGKTYSVNHKLLGKYNIPIKGIAIDGEEMRQASKVYQKSIPILKKKTYKKLFKNANAKSKSIKILLSLFKNNIKSFNKKCIMISKKSKNTYDIKSKDLIEAKLVQKYKKEINSFEYINELVCYSHKPTLENCRKDPCQVYKSIRNSKNPMNALVVVDTFNEFKANIHKDFPDAEKYWIINLSTRFICNKQGKERELKYGKEYKSYKNLKILNLDPWRLSVNKAFNLPINETKLKKQKTIVDNLLIIINLGTIKDENLNKMVNQFNKNHNLIKNGQTYNNLKNKITIPELLKIKSAWLKLSKEIDNYLENQKNQKDKKISQKNQNKNQKVKKISQKNHKKITKKISKKQQK